MTTYGMKRYMILLANIVVFLSIILIGMKGFSKIPEPDNIIYGIPPNDTNIVSLKIDGQLIASYTMGSNPDANIYYILKVPIDTLDPQAPGTARPGDEASIYINDESIPVTTITIGERGSIFEKHLPPADSDGDGLPDQFEQLIIDADLFDNINTLADVHPRDDFDGDGFSNLRELLSYSDALLIEDIPECWADVFIDGDVDGEDLGIFIDEMYHNDCPCTLDMDGDGDVDDLDLLFFCEDFGSTDCD